MRLLLIEDEEKLAKSLKKALETQTFAVDVKYDGQEGLDIAFGDEYDLIILDLGLPNLDGIEITKRLREENIITPILMLTARDNLKNKVEGLDIGADDYLVKPFEFDELLARIRALLRRNNGNIQSTFKVDNLSLDPSSHLVYRGENEINLSAKEYALLEYLIRNSGHIVSKQQIIDHVWDIDLDPFSNVVDVYIGYLRSKIDRAFPNDPPLIKTIKGLGYKLGI